MYFSSPPAGVVDCHFYQPFMPEIAADFPDFQFIEVDRDKFIDVAAEWNVWIPSLLW